MRSRANGGVGGTLDSWVSSALANIFTKLSESLGGRPKEIVGIKFNKDLGNECFAAGNGPQ